MGKHFIEGYWVDKVIISNDPEQIDSVAIFNILYSDGYYQVKGDSVSLDGDYLGNFNCYISNYDDFKLRYAYEGTNIRQANSRVEGYGEYHFSCGQKIPLHLTGFIEDSYHTGRLGLQAQKIVDKSILETIDQQQTRQRIIQDYLNQ